MYAPAGHAEHLTCHARTFAVQSWILDLYIHYHYIPLSLPSRSSPQPQLAAAIDTVITDACAACCSSTIGCSLGRCIAAGYRICFWLGWPERVHFAGLCRVVSWYVRGPASRCRKAGSISSHSLRELAINQSTCTKSHASSLLFMPDHNQTPIPPHHPHSPWPAADCRAEGGCRARW